MDSMRKITELIDTRSEELTRQKEQGKKIVGIVGPGYTPEELIYAAGAIPQRLFRGGDPAAIDESRQYSHNCFSTFHKAQIGYLMHGRDPLYLLPDHYVFESGDEHSELTGMYVYPHKEMSATWLGVPGNPDYEGAFPYYVTALRKLQAEIEDLTGNKVSDDALVEYASVYNEVRRLLKWIADLRKAENPPISGLEFLKLNHGSYYCDPHEYRPLLESLCAELESGPVVSTGSKPRVGVFGCPMGVGDYALLELIESAGGIVVTEELSGSLRCLHQETAINGIPLEDLARRYFAKKKTDAYCYPWHEDLMSLHTDKIKDFKIDGVVWYQLIYMACHSMFGYAIEKRIRATGTPFLTIQSEYDFEARIEAVRTRVETFVEMIKG